MIPPAAFATSDVGDAAPAPREPTESRDERRRQRAAARAAERAIPPTRDEAFSHLGLEHLRAYRQGLVTEEDTISYWRRLLQTRLDVMRAGDRLTAVDPSQLRTILSSDRALTGRTNLVSIVAGEDVPALPDLARLWSAEPTDEVSRAIHIDELTAAERDLSSYRNTLHRRLDAATAELIARYHDDPTACLVALPLPSEDR